MLRFTWLVPGFTHLIIMPEMATIRWPELPMASAGSGVIGTAIAAPGPG
jgi:hypothetical protein